MSGDPCIHCGGSANGTFLGSPICEGCIPDEENEFTVEGTLETGDGDSRLDADSAHQNPIDVRDVTGAERAQIRRDYLRAFVAEFGSVPRQMPLDDEGKAPIIQGRCPLDSPEGRSYLVDGDEAIREFRELVLTATVSNLGRAIKE